MHYGWSLHPPLLSPWCSHHSEQGESGLIRTTGPSFIAPESNLDASDELPWSEVSWRLHISLVSVPSVLFTPCGNVLSLLNTVVSSAVDLLRFDFTSVSVISHHSTCFSDHISSEDEGSPRSVQVFMKRQSVLTQSEEFQQLLGCFLCLMQDSNWTLQNRSDIFSTTTGFILKNQKLLTASVRSITCYQLKQMNHCSYDPVEGSDPFASLNPGVRHNLFMIAVRSAETIFIKRTSLFSYLQERASAPRPVLRGCDLNCTVTSNKVSVQHLIRSHYTGTSLNGE